MLTSYCLHSIVRIRRIAFYITMAVLSKNPLISIHLLTMICFQCVSRSEEHDKKKINSNNNKIRKKK